MYMWWRKHCILPLELSALAYFRICMGLLSLYNVIEVWYYHEEWLLDSGYLPRIDVMMSARHDLLDKNAFNIYLCSGEKHIILSLLFVHTISTISYVIGYKTKLSSIILFVFDFSLKTRITTIDYGADFLRVNCIFWSMFLPIEKRWSIDSFIDRYYMKKETKEKNLAVHEKEDDDDGGFTSYILLFQIIHMYGNAGRHKHGDVWLGGDAIERVLECTMFSKQNFIKDTLLEMPNLLNHITKLTLLLEIYAFVFFLIPSSAIRGNAAVLYISLHLGMWLTIEVGMFPPVCIALLLCTFPSTACKIIDRTLTYIVNTRWNLTVYMTQMLEYIEEYVKEDEQYATRTTKQLKENKKNTKKRNGGENKYDCKNKCSITSTIKSSFLLLMIYVILAIDDERSFTSSRHEKQSWTYYFTGKSGILYAPESLKTLAFTLSHEQLYNLFAPNVPLNYWLETYGIVRNKTTNEYYYFRLFNKGHLDLKFQPRVNQVHQVSLALQIRAKFSRPDPTSIIISNHRIFSLIDRGIINYPFTNYLCNTFHHVNNDIENDEDEYTGLEFIGARILEYNSHGIVQRAPPRNIPWRGLKVYSRKALWCKDIYENHVLSFLRDVLDERE
eukprot:g2903.t1